MEPGHSHSSNVVLSSERPTLGIWIGIGSSAGRYLEACFAASRLCVLFKGLLGASGLLPPVIRNTSAIWQTVAGDPRGLALCPHTLVDGCQLLIFCSSRGQKTVGIPKISSVLSISRTDLIPRNGATGVYWLNKKSYLICPGDVGFITFQALRNLSSIPGEPAAGRDQCSITELT